MTNAVSKGLTRPEIQAILTDIAKDAKQPGQARVEAIGLYLEAIDQLPFRPEGETNQK